MTNWTPDLDVRPGPRYLAIALALGEAIADPVPGEVSLAEPAAATQDLEPVTAQGLERARRRVDALAAPWHRSGDQRGEEPLAAKGVCLPVATSTSHSDPAMRSVMMSPARRT